MTEDDRKLFLEMDAGWRETFHNFCDAFRLQRDQLKTLAEEVRRLTEEVRTLRQERQGSLFERGDAL